MNRTCYIVSTFDLPINVQENNHKRWASLCIGEILNNPNWKDYKLYIYKVQIDETSTYISNISSGLFFINNYFIVKKVMMRMGFSS